MSEGRPAEAPTSPCALHPSAAVVACARCGTFVCTQCAPGRVCGACAPLLAHQAEVALRQRTSERTTRIALLLGALFFALPGIVSWAILGEKTGTNELEQLVFALMFSAAPFLALVLLQLFRRWWLVTLALPTTLLNMVLWTQLEPSPVTYSFMFAAAMIGVAFARALHGRFVEQPRAARSLREGSASPP